MFVGGGMKDIVGLEGGEDMLHFTSIGDGGDHCGGFDFWPFAGHHQADVMLGCLGRINEHQCRRFVGTDLADDFRADWTCRTRDENSCAREHLANAQHIHLNFFTGEKILNADGLHLYLGEVRVLGPLLSALAHVDFDVGIEQRIL